MRIVRLLGAAALLAAVACGQRPATFFVFGFFVLSLQSLRKDGRVAEGAGLENRYTLHGVSGVRIPLLPQSREQHRSIAAVLFCYIAEPGLPGRQQNNDYSWKEYPNPAREVRLSA